MTVNLYEPPTSGVAVPQQSQADQLMGWTRAAASAYELAQQLCVTSFVPVQFKNKPQETAAAMLAGAEVGLSPLAAVRSFDIIQGVAAARALTLRAIVQAAGHDIWLVESTADRCVMSGKRRGSDQTQTVTWTIGRARDMQLTGKGEWKKQPTAMLLARATSELARLVGADAILGIPYSIEELQDETPAAMVGEPVPAVAPAPRTTRRKTAPAVKAVANTVPPSAAEAAASGPALPGEDDYDEPAPVEDPPVDDDGVAMVTKPQLTKLAICLKEAGLTDRDRGLAFLSKMTHRAITTSKSLTSEEASTVIDSLEALTNDDVAAIVDGATAEPDQLTIDDDPPF